MNEDDVFVNRALQSLLEGFIKQVEAIRLCPVGNRKVLITELARRLMDFVKEHELMLTTLTDVKDWIGEEGE